MIWPQAVEGSGLANYYAVYRHQTKKIKWEK